MNQALILNGKVVASKRRGEAFDTAKNDFLLRAAHIATIHFMPRSVGESCAGSVILAKRSCDTSRGGPYEANPRLRVPLAESTVLNRTTIRSQARGLPGRKHKSNQMVPGLRA
jgi:hypothetical protein